MFKLFINEIHNGYVDWVNTFISNIFYESKSYVRYLIWLLILLGVFNIFWGFFLRVNKNIRTSDLINRLFISGVLFYFVWFLNSLLGVNI